MVFTYAVQNINLQDSSASSYLNYINRRFPHAVALLNWLRLIFGIKCDSSKGRPTQIYNRHAGSFLGGKRLYDAHRVSRKYGS